MYCYRATVQTDKGDALVGWQIECVQNDNLTTPVTIYADENSTPISSVSGVSNRAVSDGAGNFYFFVANGLYGLRYYDAEGVYQRTERYFSMAALTPLDVDNTGLLTGVTAANIASSGTSTLFIRPSVNVSDGTLFKSATTNYATDKPLEVIGSTILFEPSTKVAINPTPSSYTQGVVITQTTPASGSTAGPFYFNKIEATVRSALTGSGLPGGASSATFAGIQVSVNAGGANFDAVSVMGGSYGVTQTVTDTSGSDKNGLSSGVAISAGISTAGKIYGGSSAITVEAGASCAAGVGYETDIFIASGSTVPYVVGFNAWKGGTGSGSSVDAAYAIGMSGDVSAAKWQTGFILYTQGGATGFPLASTGSLFRSDSAATIGSVLDFNNLIIADWIFRFNSDAVRLSGAGALSLNTSIAGVGVGRLASSSAWIGTAASTTSKAALNLIAGVAPTSPTNGDIWFDGTHLYCRIGGVTKQLDN